MRLQTATGLLPQYSWMPAGEYTWGSCSSSTPSTISSSCICRAEQWCLVETLMCDQVNRSPFTGQPASPRLAWPTSAAVHAFPAMPARG